MGNENEDPGGAQYLVMPLMQGGDLANALERLCAVERVRVMQDTLRGLQALHDAEILHFDVKPENILLDAQGRSRLADCGLARPMVGSSSNATMAQQSTHVGQVGTPGYIDPEYTRTGQFHRHCDVYAIGCTILQILTGRPSVLW